MGSSGSSSATYLVRGQSGYLRSSVKQTFPQKNALSTPSKQLSKLEGSQTVWSMLHMLPLGGAISYLSIQGPSCNLSWFWLLICFVLFCFNLVYVCMSMWHVYVRRHMQAVRTAERHSLTGKTDWKRRSKLLSCLQLPVSPGFQFSWAEVGCGGAAVFEIFLLTNIPLNITNKIHWFTKLNFCLSWIP